MRGTLTDPMVVNVLVWDKSTPCRHSLSAEFIEIKGMGKGRENGRDTEKTILREGRRRGKKKKEVKHF